MALAPMALLLGIGEPALAAAATEKEPQKLTDIADMASGVTPLPQAPPGKVGVWLGKVQSSQHFLSAFKAKASYTIAAKTSALDPAAAATPNSAPRSPVSFVSLSVDSLAALPRPTDVGAHATAVEKEATRVPLCDGPEAFCRSFTRSFTLKRANGSTFITGTTVTPDGVPHFAWFRATQSGHIKGWVSGADIDYSFTKLTGDQAQALYSVRETAHVDRYPNDVRRAAGGPAPSAPAPAQPLTPAATAPDCANPPHSQVITVAVKYTAQAKAAALAQGFDIEEQVATAADLANFSLKGANIAGEIKVPSITQAKASEGDTNAKRPFDAILDDLLSASPSTWGDLIRARDAAKADVAIVVIENTDNRNCGQSAGYRVDAKEAIAAVNWRCIATRYSFVHEIGHLVGLYHDPATRRQYDNVPDNEVLPPYAQGFITSGVHPTASVMAYVTACPSDCGRWPFWSDPSRTNQYGVAMGTPTAAFETCVWRQRLATVASFHTLR